MFKKLKEINQKNNIERISGILVIVAMILLLNVFTVYYKTKLNLTNPLIPKYLIDGVFAPYALKGIILSCGILAATILKFFRQNLAAIIFCAIAIILYYFTSFEPDFSDYQ